MPGSRTTAVPGRDAWNWRIAASLIAVPSTWIVRHAGKRGSASRPASETRVWPRSSSVRLCKPERWASPASVIAVPASQRCTSFFAPESALSASSSIAEPERSSVLQAGQQRAERREVADRGADQGQITQLGQPGDCFEAFLGDLRPRTHEGSQRRVMCEPLQILIPESDRAQRKVLQFSEPTEVQAPSAGQGAIQG